MTAVRKIFVGALLSAACVAAMAAPVRYTFTSDLAPVTPNTGANFSGYVEFDDSLLAANAVISTSSFTDWAFKWGDDITYAMGTSFFDAGFSTFILGASLEAADVDLCFSTTGICQTGDHPVARVLTDAVGATYAPLQQTSASGVWSGPQTVGQLPEPASLALAGLALLGLGIARRKRG